MIERETFHHPTTPEERQAASALTHAVIRLVDAADLTPGESWETTLKNRTLGLEVSVSISLQKLRGEA